MEKVFVVLGVVFMSAIFTALLFPIGYAANLYLYGFAGLLYSAQNAAMGMMIVMIAIFVSTVLYGINEFGWYVARKFYP